MTKNRLVPHLYLKIDYGDRVRIGPGKVQLLKLIREKSSISAAARAMGMSYRRAWLLVEETSKIFGRPVISTHVGGKGHGGAQLTPLGEKVIETYETIVAKTEAVVEAELQALCADAAAVAKARRDAGRSAQ
jgi:molybdate transport system regulatory protein